MNFFFIQDHQSRYRYFSSEPPKLIEVRLSKPKRAWELAKKKLMLLPQRTLRQEQAFERAIIHGGKPLRILHAAGVGEEEIRDRFTAFLRKQRASHVAVLVGEAILVPISGVVALLPGPNIAFYALALLMITQWLAFRGIQRTLQAEYDFVPDERFSAWEKAVQAGDEGKFPVILQSIEAEHGLKDLRKILWPGKRVRNP